MLCKRVCQALGATIVDDMRLVQDSDIDDLRATLDLTPIQIRKLKAIVSELQARSGRGAGGGLHSESVHTSNYWVLFKEISKMHVLAGKRLRVWQYICGPY